MKRNYILAAICLLWAINANALIVSVNGQGDIEEQGLEVTLNDAEEDPLSGKILMKLDGNLLCQGTLTVTISRSSAGMEDEFCCGQCFTGNGETNQTLTFTPDGLSDWFIHYTPTPNSHETIVYTFSDSAESLILTVHFNYDAQGIEEVQKDDVPCTKFIRNGIVYIEYNNHIYPL